MDDVGIVANFEMKTIASLVGESLLLFTGNNSLIDGDNAILELFILNSLDLISFDLRDQYRDSSKYRGLTNIRA